jgi:hypothetical protein
MKYTLAVAMLSILVACKNRPEAPRNPKEILKLVDEGNDGWNAFPIAFSDDSTFKIEYFSFGDPDIETGKYSISEKSIYVFRQNSRKDKIIFDRTSTGCLYNVKYLSGDRTINMRVVRDSLFCDHSYDKKIAGTWRCYETNVKGSDTLKLNNDGTARFKGNNYASWHFDNPYLYLSWKSMSAQLLVRSLTDDSLMFRTSWPFGDADSIRASRIK